MKLFRRLLSKIVTKHLSSSIDVENTSPVTREIVPPLEKLNGLVLYKFDSCPYCKVVMRVINHLNIDVEYRDTRMDRKWREDLLRRTNRTQVPCLFIDGEPMFESMDIVTWLKAEFQ